MSYVVRFIKEAHKDFLRLDHSQQDTVVKALKKVAKNPLPANEGGYGKPLGHHAGSDLRGLLKIKLRDAGLRIVYKLERKESSLVVIVIGFRDDSEVYRLAARRIKSHGLH